MKVSDILAKLIEQPTLTEDVLANANAFKIIKKQLKHLPLHFEEHVSLEHPSLLITTQKTKTPRLWLQAHIDVVPGSIEMFRPKIKNGKLYGRGAYDMKFAVACYLKLMLELGSDLKKYDFGLMLTSDEEDGGINGVKYLLDEGYTSEACLLPDAGLNWALEEQAKGIMRIQVIANGKSGHAAHPWDANNAAHSINLFLSELIGKFKLANSNKAAHKTTCSITNIHSSAESSAVNQIPDYVEATVDIRPVSHADRIRVDRLLERLSAKHKNVTIDIVTEADPYSIIVKNGYVKAWNEAAKKHGKYRRNFTKSYGSSDARFFSEKGITTIATRPKGAGLHSESEWIDVEDLEKFYKVLRDFTKQTTLI